MSPRNRITYSKASSCRQRVEQIAVPKARGPPRRWTFTTGRQHLPQPAQHLVLIAPLITLQRRGRRPSTAGASRAWPVTIGQTVSCPSAATSSSNPARRPLRCAGADDERRPSKKAQTSVDCSAADPPASHHAWCNAAHGLGRRAPLHGQRSARQHAHGCVSRQHPLGMQVAYKVVMKFRRSVSGAIARMRRPVSDVYAYNHILIHSAPPFDFIT